MHVLLDTEQLQISNHTFEYYFKVQVQNTELN